MAYQILQILILAFFPAVAMKLNSTYKQVSFISPIVLCFAIGILIQNLNIFALDDQISGGFRDGTILFALPLLLFSSDVKAWISQSKDTVIAFAIAVFSGIIATSLAAFIFQNDIAEVWKPAGMMMGIHSGGTPNLFAVGIALEASDEVLTLTNSAQILWGAIYLFFLLSAGPFVFGKLLPSQDVQREVSEEPYLKNAKMNWQHVLIAIGISTLIIAVSIGLSYLLFDNLVSTFVIVFVTTMAIISSFSKRIRALDGPFEVGDYLLLVFGIAVGMMSDFWTLLEKGGPFILFVGLIFISTVIVQTILFRLLKIDRDTFIIASAATIYGPVFIPQVAQVLKNRSLILGGIAISLLGLAVGNYIGLLVGYFLRIILL